MSAEVQRELRNAAKGIARLRLDGFYDRVSAHKVWADVKRRYGA